MSFSTQKLAVRDNFDDEDISDDVEDEVFIRDGRNGFRSDEERGVKRPLMAPKRKSKSGLLHSEPCKRNSWHVFCIPCFYGILALTALIGLIAGVVGLVLWLPFSMDQVVFWKHHAGPVVVAEAPCTKLQTHDVWTRSFLKLTVEAALVARDVNGDQLDDVIVGYGTGLDGQEMQGLSCELYFGRKSPCSGGVMALDGRTGEVIWRHWTEHSVYTVDCGADLTADGVADCLAAGKAGVLHAVNGHDGSSVWEFSEDTEEERSGRVLVDVYAPRFVRDVDSDGVQDVLAAHTWFQVGEADSLPTGELLLLSGARGGILWQVRLPGSEEGYHSPQVMVHPDGEEFVVFGTGGQATAGGLYVVPFDSLVDMKDVNVLYRNPYKGVISPPVLVDINRDGSEDIVVATFNSSVLAFDGLTFEPLWNFSFPMSESFSPPTPGYFNDDDTPDFLVQYNTGPGFPTYFFSQTTVLDGRTGVPLLKHPIVHTLGSEAPSVALSLAGYGNDFLLYWAGDCVGHEGATEAFSFLPGSSVRAQNNADLCWQRFNATTFNRLYALNQHVASPGLILYSSDERKPLEYGNAANASGEVEQYLASHPELKDAYGANPPQELDKKNWGPGKGPSSFRHKEAGESVLVGDVFPEMGRVRQGMDKRPSYGGQRKNRPEADPWRHRPDNAWYPGSPEYEVPYEPVSDEYSKLRSKRSHGPGLVRGIHRLTSTGVLVVPLERASKNSSVDIIFVTYWVPLTADARVLSPAAKKCVETKQSQSAGVFQPLAAALEECAGVSASIRAPDSGLEVQMGQLTVYRMRISCACLVADGCVPVLPLEKQSWPAYQGRNGSGTFFSRHS